MDTALLQTFREVARRRSITAAALSLGYTQSAVSRQVAALEASLGARIFDRGARGVLLTEHGRCLLPHVDSVLERLETARRDLEALDRGEGGRLRVGAFHTATARLIPQALAAFRSKHPKVRLSLVEGTTRRQLANLEAGDVDLAVLSAFPHHELDGRPLTRVHLLDDAMLIALPRSHPLARRRSLRLSELAGESWIGPDASDDDRLLGPARLPGSDAQADFVVRDWTAKLGLAAAGLGITLVPSLAAAAARADIALVPLDPKDAPPRSVFAATPQGVANPASIDAFIDELRAAARRMA
jgi:DNA-binding transcriptional LysR family regulator